MGYCRLPCDCGETVRPRCHSLEHPRMRLLIQSRLMLLCDSSIGLPARAA